METSDAKLVADVVINLFGGQSSHYCSQSFSCVSKTCDLPKGAICALAWYIFFFDKSDCLVDRQFRFNCY